MYLTIYIYFRHRIMLEDYVICKMPIQAPTLVNISQQPQSLLSPWSLILPLLIVVLLCLIIIYHVKCTMKCSSYLSNLHLPLKLDEETSVWNASQASYLQLFHKKELNIKVILVWQKIYRIQLQIFLLPITFYSLLIW